MNITTTLPKHVVDLLAKKANELNMPKNKIIERALDIYLEQLDRAAYEKSYKRMAKDPDMIAMAEEGMADYLELLKEFDQK